ncbi:MAG: PHB depolymerase family esterase [Propionicimonas sp.]|uniref:alpha/beta hydrolase family esterase n=1 Tax=Propionicimonas sp. TaxID=1955623 RepID=UPI003D134F68
MSASSTATGGSAGPGSSTIEVQGRKVALFTPAAVDADTALVVVLHGYTGEAVGTAQYLGLAAAAGPRNLVVAAPQGTTDAEGNTFWNASSACCNFDGSTVDDSAFLSTVITAVVAQFGVDPGRVFVVGHSNGGFMAHRLACEHADQVAAVVSLAGAMDVAGSCDPSRPVSVLQVHGEADDTILFGGGSIQGHEYTSALTTVGRWRHLNECAGSGQRWTPGIDADTASEGADLTGTSWTGCADGTSVALWRIAGGSHVPSLTPAFTDALVDWLEAHAR